MCVAWIRYEIERGPSIVSPREGAKDGPRQPYPTPRWDGRGSDHPLVPHRRRLRVAQPAWRSTLRIHKAACGLGGHHPGTFPAAAGSGERTLLLAGRREVLFSPVPRGGGAAPFLVASAGGGDEGRPLGRVPREDLPGN